MTQQDRSALNAIELERARAFISTVTFTYASTLPEHPHEYVARSRLTPELQAEFDALVALIESTGYAGRFWSATWTYLDVGEWAYWPSQSWYGPDAGKPNTMLNRRRLDDGQQRLGVER